tara:strand:- start:3184 stop:3453 length:270 start_codon:yes stop_codon:yes gene_type:complete
MKFVNVRELKNKTSEILRLSQEDDVIITTNGKPTAVVKGISEEDLEDYLIENNPKFLKTLEDARKEFQKKGGVSTEDYLKKRKKKRARI